jgi:hypothetical protein
MIQEAISEMEAMGKGMGAKGIQDDAARMVFGKSCS